MSIDKKMKEKPCRIIKQGNRVDLVAPAFVYTLDTADQLKAVKLENLCCGHTLQLGQGLEFAADFDQADARIHIDGWKVRDSRNSGDMPDTEEGYLNGFFRYDFNDSKWDGCQSPVMFEDFKFDKAKYKWARTHLFIPGEHAGKRITLHIGGIGLLDFGYLRVFINGHEIGTRITNQRWHEPGCFEIGESSDSSACLRFGQDNIIALQLSDYLCRDRKLDQYDPLKGRELATIGRSWPGQFEQYITIGQPLDTPIWKVTGQTSIAEGEHGRIDFMLKTEQGNLSAVVSYWWSRSDFALHKAITLRNDSAETRCLMNVALGQYRTTTELTEGEQGFPVYLDNCCFLAIAHPSGWVTGQDCLVTLKQYPGKRLAAGASFTSMETVIGVAGAQQARESFLRHIESRMRRVRRGHNGPVSTFDSFGSWPIRPLEVDYGHFPDEKAILHNLAQVEKGQREDGCHFDYYTIEFWNDYYGDFQRPGSERFPQGFDAIKRSLAALGSGLGLWVDTSAGRWSIGGNPVVQNCLTYNYAAYKSETQVALLDKCYCRAAEPYRSMLMNGLLYQLRENDVRLFKFDDAMAVCHNPNHSHLPGLYSTEAIQNEEIELLQVLDLASPDLFLVLYWGHRSPWWLLHADTLFESGLFLEASTPASYPTLYARDGVTITLDQAACWRDDIPLLGKDSLGVWLSAWAWNSSIHNERWQEGIIMDLCRGSLLYQFWSDPSWLSANERKQAAVFGEMLQQNADCFKNSRLILGDPWQNEPYGYCCSNGHHAFICINNCSWSDLAITLALNDQWGLDSALVWHVFEWYPRQGHYQAGPNSAGPASISLRPFEVLLLEAVAQTEPAPQAEACQPVTRGEHHSKPLSRQFSEPTQKLELSVRELDRTDGMRLELEDFIANTGDIGGERAVDVHEWSDVPPRIRKTANLADYEGYKKKTYEIVADRPTGTTPGMLYFAVKMFKDSALFKLENLGMHFAAQAKIDGRYLDCEAVIGPLTYAVPWQGWRVKIPDTTHGNRRIEMTIATMLPEDTDLEFESYFIPE